MLWALVVAAPAPLPEWAPVAITHNAETRLYFVDRTSIAATARGTSARIFMSSGTVSAGMHFEYGCDKGRFRILDVSLPEGETPPAAGPVATPWRPITPGTPLHNAMRYACSGGTLDLGFGDLRVKADSPEAFARTFIAERAKRK